MKILIINVAGDTARMAFQDQQMAALGLTFERLNAVTPATVTTPLDDPAWNTWQRPLKHVEKALLSSHRQAWARVVGEGRPCLILEDDAYLSADTPRFLASAEKQFGIDHISLETRNRKKLLGKTPHADLPMRRLYQDKSGAAAYILWPRAADRLLSKHAGLADALLCAAYDLMAWQAVPALAIQLDQCAAYGLDQPIEVTSAPLSDHAPAQDDLPAATKFGFRWRRNAAQLSMALRHLRHSHHARRQFVAPAGDIGGWRAS